MDISFALQRWKCWDTECVNRNKICFATQTGWQVVIHGNSKINLETKLCCFIVDESRDVLVTRNVLLVRASRHLNKVIPVHCPLLFGCWDDHHRNPNINNKDHQQRSSSISLSHPTLYNHHKCQHNTCMEIKWFLFDFDLSVVPCSFEQSGQLTSMYFTFTFISIITAIKFALSLPKRVEKNREWEETGWCDLNWP